MTKVESDDTIFSGIVILVALVLGRFLDDKEMVYKMFLFRMYPSSDIQRL